MKSANDSKIKRFKESVSHESIPKRSKYFNENKNLMNEMNFHSDPTQGLVGFIKVPNSRSISPSNVHSSLISNSTLSLVDKKKTNKRNLPLPLWWHFFSVA